MITVSLPEAPLSLTSSVGVDLFFPFPPHMTSPAVTQKFPPAKQYLQFLNLFSVKQREYCCLHIYALLESVHYRLGHSISTCNSFFVNLPLLFISVLVFYPLERYGTLKSYDPCFCKGKPQRHSGKTLISISHL